jgi:ClpP class serine protease
MEMQANVDALYDHLVTPVARHRRRTPEALRATEVAVYRGQRGVGLGLTNAVGTTAKALAAGTGRGSVAGSLWPRRVTLHRAHQAIWLDDYQPLDDDRPVSRGFPRHPT